MTNTPSDDAATNPSDEPTTDPISATPEPVSVESVYASSATSTVASSIAPPPARRVRPMLVGVMLALVIALGLAVTVFTSLGEEQTSRSSAAEEAPDRDLIRDPDTPAPAAPSTGDAPTSGTDTLDGGTSGEIALPAGVPAANRGYVFGDPDSAATYVDVWADPQCPYCKVFHEVGDAIIDDSVAAGNTAVEHFFVGFLGEDSIRAGNAVGCAADAGAFDRFIDTMYLNQPQEPGVGYPVETLLRFGELSQVENMAAFEQCVREEPYVAYVQSLTDFMPSAGVQATPTIRVNGEDVDISTVTVDQFTALVNDFPIAVDEGATPPEGQPDGTEGSTDTDSSETAETAEDANGADSADGSTADSPAETN